VKAILKNKTLFYSAFAVILVLLKADAAVAAEGAGEWRATYDLIMRWLNFGILVFLFFKYAKTPLMNFLKTRGDTIAGDIKKLEDSKNAAVERNKAFSVQIGKREERMAEIKEKIVLQGEKEKQKIIEDARVQSRYLLEEAKRRMASNVIQAKRKLQSELVDEAISMAAKNLPSQITTEDNKMFLDNYLSVSEKK
jgi:F-type H+-transporting ATPase subunit b